MNEDKIDSLQSQIDELGDLCAEIMSADEEILDERERRLSNLILHLQEGTLDKRYALRLEKWLLSDPNALEYYVEFVNVMAMLYLHYHPEACQKFPVQAGAHA